jgi:hypothetical protein
MHDATTEDGNSNHAIKEVPFEATTITPPSV